MRDLWGSARAKLVATALVAVVIVVSLIALLGSSASPPKETTARTGPAVAGRTSTTYHPLRITPPQTAVERTVNEAMSQNLNSQGLAALEATTFPLPDISTAFPSIDRADSSSPSMYALAFTQELLDINFAASTRNALLSWAGYNNAPYTLTSLPTALSVKALAASLTTSPAVVPSATRWSALAKARTLWRVSGLVISVSPVWTQILSAGWVPVDPLMVIYDVSGTLTVTTPGRSPVVESISFGLTLGGASLHPGYGAVAVDYWTVQ
jgi:hypothetical protein